MIGIKQRVLLILLSIISLVFIFRLFHLQIFTSDFKLLSEQNIVQENVIFPSRGIVFDRNNKIVGCIHAGWRGAFSNIIKNTVKN